MLRLLAIVLGAAVSTAACASRSPERAAAPARTRAQGECRVDCNNAIADEPDKCPEKVEDCAGLQDLDGCPCRDPADAISELALPAAACVLATDRWKGTDLITELRLSPGGPVYAVITGPRASLHLAAGPSGADSALEVEDAGVSLRGFLKRGAFALHPGKPLVLGGCVIPTAFATLSYAEARDGQVSIGYDIGPGVELSVSLVANVSCSDVTVDFAGFSATDSLGDETKAKYEELRLGRAIDLRAQPGGEVVARLRAKDVEDSVIQVLESSGRSKRIMWWRDTAVVFGWVATSELRPLSITLTGYATGHGSPVLPKRTSKLEVLRCDRDVTLFAEAGGQRAKVGRIRAGMALDVLSREHDFCSVQPQSKTIAPALGAKLLASTRELASCAKVH